MRGMSHEVDPEITSPSNSPSSAKRRGFYGVEWLEGRPLLASIVFDPDGPGPLTPFNITPSGTINGFDFSVGNVLSVDAVTAINQKATAPPGTPNPRFQLYYQSTLAGFIDPSGNTVSVEGLNDPTSLRPFEITAVASVTEEVTSVDTATGTANFAVVPDQSPESYFRFFFDTSLNANALSGTGFTDGVQILSGGPVASSEGTGVFRINTENDPVTGIPGPAIRPFDQFGPNDYGGQLSVQGVGASVATTPVTSLNLAFFLTPFLDLSFNTTNTAPFLTTDPSQAFSRLAAGGTFTTFSPALGPVNGLSGPDFQFAADANAAPGTLEAPGINLVKLTNGTDNDTPTGPIVPVGSTVTFTYVVTNTGNVPLSGVTVVRRQRHARQPGRRLRRHLRRRRHQRRRPAGPDRDLDLHRHADRHRRPVHQPRHRHRHAAAGRRPPVTDTNPDNHFGAAPGINLVKLTNGTDNDTPTGPLVPVGSTVTFTYVVTNTGNVPLSGVTVARRQRHARRPGRRLRRHLRRRRRRRQRPARPDRDLDLHRLADRHRRPVHQPRHRHRHAAAGRRPAGHRHQPRQPLRRRAGHQPRQADQRHRQRHAHRPVRAGRQHGDLHLRRHQHRQRPAVRRDGPRRQRHARRPGRRLRRHLRRRRRQRRRPARPRPRPGPSPPRGSPPPASTPTSAPPPARPRPAAARRSPTPTPTTTSAPRRRSTSSS